MSTHTSIEEFEELQVVMKEFSLQVERKLTEKRALLIEEKQEHHIKLNELRSEEVRLRGEIENLESKETKTKENLKSALESLRVQRSKVDELIRKQEQLVEQRNELQTQVGELTQSIEKSGQELESSQKSLHRQIRRNYPELVKFEQYLGLRIEAVTVDLIKFIFTNIDSSDFDREFWIDLSVSEEAYRVVGSSSLDSDTLKQIENEFNEHKELVRFLKTTRDHFLKQV